VFSDSSEQEIPVMKKINFVLALVLATVNAQFLLAQSSPSSSVNDPQSAASSSKSASKDGELTQKLQSKFGQDPAFANVLVSVTKGTATITGSVPAKADKKRAKEMAKSVAGVKHVKEELTINPSASHSTNSANDNKPADAGVTSGSSNADAAAASSSGAANPANSLPNSDQNAASSASAAPNSANPVSGQTSSTSNTRSSQVANTTGSSASAAPPTGENASSAPQNQGNAASENNLAGQGAPNGQSATAPNAGQPNVSSGAIGANAGGGAPATAPNAGGEAGISVNDSATLQSQIQTAMQNEPTLRNDNVNVSVTESTIELSGTVQNGKEKETARRIASSFAGNRRVKDRVTLSGHGAASAPNPTSSNTNPAVNAPNSNLNNANSQNPGANNPKANGDASASPR
jgi:osmotically-inducible protein OsmY